MKGRECYSILVAILGGCMILASSSCFREDGKKEKRTPKNFATDLPDSQLEEVSERRGLTDEDLIAATKTYVPTGGRDEYIGILGTGTGGLLGIYGLPSMRILKYVGVFTPEPWQGYAYDDESVELLQASGREDIKYDFGEIGLPALSLTNGRTDGVTTFVGDSANARVAVMALDDYETKQIVVNPFFRGSYPALTVTANSEYVVQVSEAPEVPQNRKAGRSLAQSFELMRGGATFWKIERGEHGDRLNQNDSFTVELPPYLQSRPVAGLELSKDWIFVVGRCRTKAQNIYHERCQKGEDDAVLHAINWKAASRLAAPEDNHFMVSLKEANVQRQISLPKGAYRLALSPDGAMLAVANSKNNELLVLDVSKMISASSENRDEYGIVTISDDQIVKSRIDLKGKATDIVYGGRNFLFASLLDPSELVRVDTTKGVVAETLALDFEPTGVMIPGSQTTEPSSKYVVVINKKPQGRFVSVGPTSGLNPLLVDTSNEMKPLYNMSVPLANDMAGVMIKADLPKSIVRYKSGTDTRSGEISLFRTVAGQEKVVRDGNRVHVFATVIRSHITPELVEVQEGDVVSFHITNLEQAQDQTHGFTVDTYNVHGSWEPGKTASVTFVADRAGVFPYYCTEFCSALHLEMQGYLLVKPKNWQPAAGTATEAGNKSTEEDKKAYEQKLVSIKETQGAIDLVVTWLKEHDYQSDSRAAALVNDAFAQMDEAKKAQEKMDAAVKQSKWSSALLWAEQYFQYQVKAADAGLRAKKMLLESGVQE
jgi:nitrous-oxide reductase